MEHVYALVISDVHLASPYSNASKLLVTLKAHQYQLLIVVGDLHEDGGEIDEAQFELVTYLRENRSRLVYVDGNHDPSEYNLIQRMIGVQVQRKHELLLSGKRFCFLHGHQFDRMSFVFNYPFVDKLFNGTTALLKKVKVSGCDLGAWMDSFHSGFSDRLAKRALKYATRNGYDRIVCGHTHIPMYLIQGGIEYFNCGGWVGDLQTFLTIQEDGTTSLRSAE